MATTETKILDEVISSRRALLLGGGALAALAFASKAASAAQAPTTYSDNDILNFALNLEYLEANFYYMAAFGCTIDKPNAVAVAAGAPATGIALNGVLGSGATTNPIAGVTATFGTATRAPFTLTQVASYAVETAIEEGKHVSLLRTALGSLAVAQPPIDISPAGAFTAVANAAGITGTFNPYAANGAIPADVNFLVGAYIFEDVGVTAYHGAAPLIKSQSILATAASILAVEAYHGGLIRTTINNNDPLGSNGYLKITDQISALRATLSLTANSTAPNPDDYGLTTSPLTPATYFMTTSGLGASATNVSRTETADQDSNALAFSRTTTSVLNIVTGGGATTAGSNAKGVFFPSGLNGLFV